MTPTVVLADPRRPIREAVVESLRLDHGISVVSTTDDAMSTCLQVQRVNPDVVVVSTALGGDLAETCRRLRHATQDVRILLADAVADEDALLLGIEAGVDGYFGGAHGVAGLADAIRSIARGESVVPPKMLGPLLRRLIERQREAADAAERLVRLTPREREVLSLITEGMDQQAVASALVISPETARTHIQRLLRKLDVRSRAEARELVAAAGLGSGLERMVERRAV